MTYRLCAWDALTGRTGKRTKYDTLEAAQAAAEAQVNTDDTNWTGPEHRGSESNTWTLFDIEAERVFVIRNWR